MLVWLGVTPGTFVECSQSNPLMWVCLKSYEIFLKTLCLVVTEVSTGLICSGTLGLRGFFSIPVWCWNQCEASLLIVVLVAWSAPWKCCSYQYKRVGFWRARFDVLSCNISTSMKVVFINSAWSTWWDPSPSHHVIIFIFPFSGLSPI